MKETEVKSYHITQVEKPIIEETLSSIKSNPIMVNNMVGYYFKDSIDRKDTFASGLINSYLGEYEIVNIETSVVDSRDLYVIFVCFLTVFISFFALFQYWKKRIDLI